VGRGSEKIEKKVGGEWLGGRETHKKGRMYRNWVSSDGEVFESRESAIAEVEQGRDVWGIRTSKSR